MNPVQLVSSCYQENVLDYNVDQLILYLLSSIHNIQHYKPIQYLFMTSQPVLKVLTLTDVLGVEVCFWVPQNVKIYRWAIMAKISANRKKFGRN